MKYITYQQKDCFTGCIVNALRALGYECSEAKILLYGNGFKIRYKPTVIDGEPRYLIVSELREACMEYLEKQGIRYDVYNGKSLEEAKDIIVDSISEQAIVLVQIWASSIHYHPVFNQTTNSMHCLNVLELNSDSAIVSDGYVPSTPVEKYEGEMPISDLNDGYEKSEKNIFVFHQGNTSSYKDKGQETVEDLIKKEKLMIKTILSEYLDGREVDGVYYGKSAIRKVCEDLQLVSEWERAPYREKIMDFNNIFKTWGFVSSKRIMAELFNEKEYLLQFADEMDNIAEQWNGLSLFFVKMGIGYRRAMLTEILEKVDGILLEEEELFRKVIKSME